MSFTWLFVLWVSGWVCQLGWVHEVKTMDTLETSIQGGGMDANGWHKH